MPNPRDPRLEPAGDGTAPRSDAARPATAVPQIRPRDAAAAFAAIAVLLCTIGILAHVEAPRAAVEAAGDPPPSLRIAVNDADRATLQLLPGIGPVLADRIVEARAAGPLADGAELQARVRGIGPVTAGRVEPYVTFE